MTTSVRVLITAATYGQKKARFVDVDGLTWTFRNAPPSVEHLDQQLDYAITDRPANHPLVERHASGLARMQTKWIEAFPDPALSVEDRLGALKGLCRNGKLIRFDYGHAESGWWRCVELSWETLQRNLNGDTTRAEVTIQFVRAIDARAGALVDTVRTTATAA